MMNMTRNVHNRST